MSDHLQLIPDKQIQRGDKIGEGGFGEVYKGSWQGYQVAIKTLRLKKLNDELREEFNREARVMAKLNHPGVIRMYGVCMEPGKYAMLMELMPRGDLYHLLSDQKQELPWGLRWQLAIDIGAGLSYLHANKILHRDLKSMNVLLDDKLRAKITDFGLSKLKVHSSSVYTNKSGGSMPWMAPELFGRRIKLSPAADVYAYGMVLWEIAARKIPFSDASNPQQIMAWILQGETEDIPKECPKPYADVMVGCWKPKPEERLTATTALQLLQKAKPQESSKKEQDVMDWLEGFALSSQSMKMHPSNNKKMGWATWQSLKTLKGHQGMVLALSFLGDNKLASASTDSKIKIWNIHTGKHLKDLSIDDGWGAHTIANLGLNRIATGSAKKTIKIWNLQTSKFRKIKGHSGAVHALIYLRNDRLASGSHDKTIKIWKIQDSTCLRTLIGHNGGIKTLATLEIETIASGSLDNTIKIWNIKTGLCLKTLTGHSDGVCALTDLSQGKIASGSHDKTIRIWSTQTGKSLKVLKGHTNSVNALAKLGKNIIASGSADDTIKIWNTDTGQCINTLEGHAWTVTALAYLGEERLASGSRDKTIKIWGKK